MRADIHKRIAQEINGFGGYLACLVCGAERSVGDTGGHLRDGWPRCCGYTMRWWTRRQIDAGEAPARRDSYQAGEGHG